MATAPMPWLKAYPHGVDWHAVLPGYSLNQLFDNSAARFAERPCIDYLGRKYRYREVADLVRRAAKGLRGMGVVKGTRVGLFLPNTPYSIILYYAILRAGGVVVNFNPLYAEAEVRRLVEDSGAEIMVTLDHARLYPAVAKMLGSGHLHHIVVCSGADVLPFPKNWLYAFLRRREIASYPDDEAHVGFAALIANDGVMDEAVIDPGRDVAVLQYSGGTTGIPKGAMLTHANLVANTTQCILWMTELHPGEEKVLAILPFFHVFAMTCCMNQGLAMGAELIVLPRFEMGLLLRTIERTRPTIFHAVPTVYTAINMRPGVSRHDLSSINYCVSGGAPLPLDVRLRFEKLTGCHLVEGYGMSECSPVATCGSLDGRSKPGSVGLPLPGTSVEIVSPDDPGRVLGPGEKGEVCIRGPQVMAGYWGKPEETATALRDGRLHSGDMGYMDEDGWLFLVDRIKDMILCSGYNVYPRIVEEAIHLHPFVAECIVIGIPDAYRGQSVKAFVTLLPGKKLSDRDLLNFLEDKLSHIEMPKEIEFRDNLPRTTIGKLSKKTLIEEDQARRAAVH